MGILIIVWWAAWGILLGYYLFVFRPRPITPLQPDLQSLPGVSVIIAVKNGSHALARHLPSILHQDYPLFEVVIVDDHSDPEHRHKLDQLKDTSPMLTIVRTDYPPGKKGALMTGVDRARYDWILCTDADCRPVTDQWIRTLLQHTSGAGMVLGYSPYPPGGGLLHVLVRFETLMTGIQYLSWALLGKPYMGVGRNLLYAKALFQSVRPYQLQNLPYGDDDLWVQQASEQTKIHVVFDPKSHVISDPPPSWSAWWRQKHRHLSAARQYSPGRWWMPGVLGIAFIVHWLLLPVALQFSQVLLVMYGLVSGLALRWWIFARWARRLNEKHLTPLYPILEILYTLYLSLVGMTTLLVKKKTWN